MLNAAKIVHYTRKTEARTTHGPELQNTA